VIEKESGSGGLDWEVDSTVGVEAGDAESEPSWEVDVEVGLTVEVEVGTDLSSFAVVDV
jgi:hypothetical protein